MSFIGGSLLGAGPWIKLAVADSAGLDYSPPPLWTLFLPVIAIALFGAALWLCRRTSSS